MDNTLKTGISSAMLHILAMAFMLCDHLWGTIIPGNDWLTCIGRLAFPIFAFMIVEGYFNTKNLKKYILRILLFALISEIPFNLMMGGRLFYPVHQNVLWSFLISICLIHLNEKAKATKKMWLRIITAFLTIISAFITGLITMVDFYHAGILTVLAFYFFRKKTVLNCICQLICLWYINAEMLGGLGYELEIFGNTFFLTRQSLALLALIPIWAYNGRRGYNSKSLQYTYYLFYPLHMLILALLR